MILQAGRFAKNKKKQDRAKKLLAQIEQIRKGVGNITIIIKDPMGNSAILNDNTEKRELTPDEIETLNSGMTIVEVKNN